MHDDLRTFLERLATQDAILVRVQDAQGSVPRAAGAWMAVFGAGAADALATIGGGRLEQDAMAHACGLLQGERLALQVRYPLGPSLGQCCGGVVELSFARVTAADVPALRVQLAPHTVPVALFGAGHVGRALVGVLGRLPFALTWIDSREQAFPLALQPLAQCEHSEPVQAAVATLAPGSCVVVMSFSHAEDLEVVAQALLRRRARGDLPYVGLIGSRSKWARFRARLRERGFDEAELAGVVCPIGVPGIADKRPEVIAVAVAAQLLQAGFPAHPASP